MESILDDSAIPAQGQPPPLSRESAAQPRPEAAAARTAILGLPWPLIASVLGSTSAIVGLLWDISWHATIGRDSFWTPAHMAVYLGGILAGLSAGWLALKTTLGGGAAERAVAVRFWGFRAPLGAWVSIWGAIAMLTSAPFDDWWHNAYGLDVKIISPPHIVLAAGILAIQLGAILQALALQNRSAAAATTMANRGARLLGLVYAYASGLLLVAISTLFLEYSEPNLQHGALFYIISAAAYPLFLAAAARGARLPWPATTVAAFYTAVRLPMTWILPLFPATPRLAPIYNPVDHMWPLFFPVVLIVPAFVCDLVLRRAGRRGGRAGGWTLALALGGAFLAVLLAVQWPLADFMMTPHARNWFFAADQWTYRTRPGPWHHEFWNAGDPFTPAALGLCLLLSTLSARLGLGWGAWMARLQR
ncbi:MAG TPA: hypothetical protein VHR45_09505 [Thermoanaerobaculia bacterium]|nr:hypothetical protein [Thermoanaerobaculia bacterium]